MFPQDLIKNTSIGKDKNVKIKFKNESLLMKIAGVLIRIFNDRFMTKYSTVLGNTIYFPSQEWLTIRMFAATKITAHELVHISDSKRLNPIIYTTMYVFPQCLFLLSFLSFLAFNNLWHLCWLGSLVCLFLPSPGRSYLEARGYAMTMFVDSILHGSSFNVEKTLERISKKFTNSDYMWMSWSKARTIDRLIKYYSRLPEEKLFKEVKKYFNN